MSPVSAPSLSSSSINVVTAAKKALAQLPGLEAEAYIVDSETYKVKVYEGEVEDLTTARSLGIGMRVFNKGALGFSYTADLSDQGLQTLARQASENAQIASPDPYGGLPDEALPYEPLQLSAADFHQVTSEFKIELAKQIEQAARAAHTDIRGCEETVYADGRSQVALVNSRGFEGSYESTYAYAYTYVFAGPQSDTQTGMAFTLGRSASDLNGERCGQEAAQRALQLLGATPCKSRSCPVLFDPYVSAGFLGVLGHALTAEAVQKGRSLFASHVGQAVASPIFTLRDEGRNLEGFASAPFDGEGTPTGSHSIIDQGRLSGFLHDATTARKDKTRSTGNAQRGGYSSLPSVGTSNLVLAPGSKSFKELLEEMGEGFYVTDLAGLHSGANPISGTFSVGASGILVRGGELCEPVEEVTIASDLLAMLKGVVAVGRQGRWLPMGGSTYAPALLLDEMMVSGR